MIISPERLREICIEHEWFTQGTSSQYDKLFRLNSEGATVDEMALVIWLCSWGTPRETIAAILERERHIYEGYKHIAGAPKPVDVNKRFSDFEINIRDYLMTYFL